VGCGPLDDHLDLQNRQAGCAYGVAAGMSVKQAELVTARAEIQRLRATMERAGLWRCTCSRDIAWGLTAGPVPPRVNARLEGRAAEAGETCLGRGWLVTAHGAHTLGLDHARVVRWLDRAAVDRLVNLQPGPGGAAACTAGLAMGGDGQAGTAIL
jgi:hypothetical protein